MTRVRMPAGTEAFEMVDRTRYVTHDGEIEVTRDDHLRALSTAVDEPGIKVLGQSYSAGGQAAGRTCPTCGFTAILALAGPRCRRCKVPWPEEATDG